MPRLGDIFGSSAALRKRWQADAGDHVIAAAWSPDGKSIAAAAVSGPVTLFDADTGKVSHRLSGHGLGTAALAWRPKSQTIATAGQDGKVRLWDATTGTEIVALAGGAAWVEHLAWSHDGAYLASAAGKKVRLWAADGTLLREYADGKSTVADLSWRKGGDDLAVAAYGGVTLYGPEGTTPRAVFEWKGSVLKLAWSPDGRFLATGNQDATVHFWIVKSGADLQMYGYPTKVRELAWDESSRWLATGGSEFVTVWDCSGKGPEGSKPQRLRTHEATITVLTFQGTGPLLASGGEDGRVCLWQPGKGVRPLSQVRIEGAVSAAAWSPADTRLLVGGAAGTVAVYGI